jgi:hypothetical protein
MFLKLTHVDLQRFELNRAKRAGFVHGKEEIVAIPSHHEDEWAIAVSVPEELINFLSTCRKELLLKDLDSHKHPDKHPIKLVSTMRAGCGLDAGCRCCRSVIAPGNLGGQGASQGWMDSGSPPR